MFENSIVPRLTLINQFLTIGSAIAYVKLILVNFSPDSLGIWYTALATLGVMNYIMMSFSPEINRTLKSSKGLIPYSFWSLTVISFFLINFLLQRSTYFIGVNPLCIAGWSLAVSTLWFQSYVMIYSDYKVVPISNLISKILFILLLVFVELKDATDLLEIYLLQFFFSRGVQFAVVIKKVLTLNSNCVGGIILSNLFKAMSGTMGVYALGPGMILILGNTDRLLLAGLMGFAFQLIDIAKNVGKSVIKDAVKLYVANGGFDDLKSVRIRSLLWYLILVLPSFGFVITINWLNIIEVDALDNIGLFIALAIPFIVIGALDIFTTSSFYVLQFNGDFSRDIGLGVLGVVAVILTIFITSYVQALYFLVLPLSVSYYIHVNHYEKYLRTT